MIVEELHNPRLLNKAGELPSSGILKCSKDDLIYLDLDDNYIYQLFPLLNQSQAEMPNYFGKDLVGAHISVIYPHEASDIHKINIGEKHYFSIKSLMKATFEDKIYYALFVDAKTLTNLRLQMNLNPQPFFKNAFINLHITIGVSSILPLDLSS